MRTMIMNRLFSRVPRYPFVADERRDGWLSGTVVLTGLACIIPVLGCSGGGVEGLYPVTGKVTYEGQPVAGAMLTFLHSGDARPATAVTKTDGSFTAMTLDSPGAYPGSYTVLVVKMDGADDPAADTDLGFDENGIDLSMEQSAQAASKPAVAPKSALPTMYASVSTSPLKFDVKEQSDNRFDVNLD
jgi:hypothetical protein